MMRAKPPEHLKNDGRPKRSFPTFVNNTLKYDMFTTPEGGKEEKMMEMTVTRNR